MVDQEFFKKIMEQQEARRTKEQMIKSIACPFAALRASDSAFDFSWRYTFGLLRRHIAWWFIEVKRAVFSSVSIDKRLPGPLKITEHLLMPLIKRINMESYLSQ